MRRTNDARQHARTGVRNLIAFRHNDACRHQALINGPNASHTDVHKEIIKKASNDFRNNKSNSFLLLNSIAIVTQVTLTPTCLCYP